jgi:hypothetical protein
MINFLTPTYTRLDFAPTKTAIVNPSPTVNLVFDDLNIPQFLTDDLAIDALAGNQAYQLIVSRVVKITSTGLMSNIWANFSKAFSYIRRAF